MSPSAAKRAPIGARDLLVGVEGMVESVAPTGFVVETFAPLGPPVWVEVLPIERPGGGEPFVGDHVVNRTLRVWTVPYRTDLDPDLVDVLKLRRLTYAGGVYDIVEASLVGRRDQIRLTTRLQGGQS
jgi:hypothetical protein